VEIVVAIVIALGVLAIGEKIKGATAERVPLRPCVLL